MRTALEPYIQTLTRRTETLKNIDYRLLDTGAFLTVAAITLTSEDCRENASEVIQKAIDLTAQNGGGTVYLGAGRYVLSRCGKDCGYSLRRVRSYRGCISESTDRACLPPR